MLRITSPQNPRIKAAAHLRDRRQRDKQRRIIIHGAREIARAAASGVELLEAYICPALAGGVEARHTAALLESAAAEVFDVTGAVFEKIAFGDRADGLAAVAAMPHRELASLTLPPCPLVAVLEGVEKPGNVGAVLRSADGAGLDAVVLADPRTDLFNPNVIRASLGTVFSLPTCAAESGEVMAWLRSRQIAIAAARVEGAVAYSQIDFRRPTAIVLGSEADGLSAAWSGEGVTAMALPMLGAADSLNVSAAAAVLFYEARRQRSAAGAAT